MDPEERLEQKIDTVVGAVHELDLKLAKIEVHLDDREALELRVTTIEKSVAKYVNYGSGMLGLMGLIITVLKVLD